MGGGSSSKPKIRIVARNKITIIVITIAIIITQTINRINFPGKQCVHDVYEQAKRAGDGVCRYRGYRVPQFGEVFHESKSMLRVLKVRSCGGRRTGCAGRREGAGRVYRKSISGEGREREHVKTKLSDGICQAKFPSVISNSAVTEEDKLPRTYGDSEAIVLICAFGFAKFRSDHNYHHHHHYYYYYYYCTSVVQNTVPFFTRIVLYYPARDGDKLGARSEIWLRGNGRTTQPSLHFSRNSCPIDRWKVSGSSYIGFSRQGSTWPNRLGFFHGLRVRTPKSRAAETIKFGLLPAISNSAKSP